MATGRRGPALVKRVLDLLGAIVLLAVTLPLIVVSALAVRMLDPGPALFRQSRGGADGRTFTICKIRTMRVAVEEQALPCLSGATTRQQWEQSRRSRDPRVIRGVGNALRRASVDELPQLWNVMRGDMSLVGPRPLELDLLEQLPEEFVRARAAVKPGLTGLWQVSGRSNLDLAQLLILDAAYIDDWSLWLDLRILMRTPVALATGRGAH